jgi:hypothetical protein
MLISCHKSIQKSISLIVLFAIQFVLLCPSSVLSQDDTVNGVVIDAVTGETLPGVNIFGERHFCRHFNRYQWRI